LHKGFNGKLGTADIPFKELLFTLFRKMYVCLIHADKNVSHCVWWSIDIFSLILLAKWAAQKKLIFLMIIFISVYRILWGSHNKLLVFVAVTIYKLCLLDKLLSVLQRISEASKCPFATAIPGRGLWLSSTKLSMLWDSRVYFLI